MRLIEAFPFCGAALSLLLMAPLARSAPSITVILGQPTDRSVTASVRSDVNLEFYFEFGLKPSTYTGRSAATLSAADPFAGGFFVSQTSLTGLQADSQYYYRLQYRTAGSDGPFTAEEEYSFHTQRRAGSSFVFCVQGDSHPEREKTMFDGNLYRQTLKAVAAEHPDFYITSGDDFSVDTLPVPYTSASVAGRYTLQLPYLGPLARSAPLFLGTGNHEETSLANYNLPADANQSNQVPVWAQKARNLYYPSPGPNDATTGTFYSGNSTAIPAIGALRDYYAWQWGDALFIVIDPYWSSPAQVDTGLGGQNSTSPKTSDKWLITHGDAQYQWLKQTLEQSTAKWKFVFAHHVLGTGRGGVEIAGQYEWGGADGNGAWGFPSKRPAWLMPIHQLMAANHVTVFFQAHDHLFARQQLDGVIYQSLPNPADNTYTAFNADAYKTGDVFPNSGYVKVSVGPSAVRVEYIREWLPADEKPPATVSGSIQFAYTITATPAAAPVISSVNAAGGGATVAPNAWMEVHGSNLSPNASARLWQASDFANNQMPAQLDGVSVNLNGKPCYVYYISPSQVNVLTPPDVSGGPAAIQVTVNGSASGTVTVPSQPAAPNFFLFGGTPYVAGTHANGSYLGPATLYPGATSPAKPGEVVVLYASGFGATTSPVVAGSTVQSGVLPVLPTVQIGGLPATVQFAGLVSPGEFQLNVTIPAGIQDGDQPITATYGGASTQPGVLLTVQH